MLSRWLGWRSHPLGRLSSESPFTAGEPGARGGPVADRRASASASASIRSMPVLPSPRTEWHSGCSLSPTSTPSQPVGILASGVGASAEAWIALIVLRLPRLVAGRSAGLMSQPLCRVRRTSNRPDTRRAGMTRSRRSRWGQVGQSGIRPLNASDHPLVTTQRVIHTSAVASDIGQTQPSSSPRRLAVHVEDVGWLAGWCSATGRAGAFRRRCGPGRRPCAGSAGGERQGRRRGSTWPGIESVRSHGVRACA